MILPNIDDDFIKKSCRLLWQAGDIALSYYQQDYDITYKKDHSPVTIVDKKIEAFLQEQLPKEDHPIFQADFPIIGEETWEEYQQNTANHFPLQHFWLIDPIDGTKEFIAKNGQFTINLALIYNHQVVFGAVLAPALQKLYVGDVKGRRAFVQLGKDAEEEKLPYDDTIQDRQDYVILESGSHYDDNDTQIYKDRLLRPYKIRESLRVGSSLKFCVLAENRGYLYPRFAHLHLWDIAAGIGVLQAAGGDIYALDDKILSNQRDHTYFEDAEAIFFGKDHRMQAPYFFARSLLK